MCTWANDDDGDGPGGGLMGGALQIGQPLAMMPSRVCWSSVF